MLASGSTVPFPAASADPAPGDCLARAFPVIFSSFSRGPALSQSVTNQPRVLLLNLNESMKLEEEMETCLTFPLPQNRFVNFVT